MSQVIQFSNHHFPVGSQAMHPEHGFVRITQIEGVKRLVSFDYYASQPLDDEPDDVIEYNIIENREAWVDVKDLTLASLLDDIKALIKRGDLVGKPEDYFFRGSN